MKYSVVIPCYCSSHTISDVVNSTSDELNKIAKNNYEFILVDDCSPDNGATISVLRSIADKNNFVTVVELARNAGQHNAIMAGLNCASGDYIILMDDDGQTHHSQLPILIDAMTDDYDVVYGYYPEKKHSSFRNFGSWVNHTLVRIMIGKPKDMKTSSYCIMRKFVRDSIIEYTAQYTHMQGLILRTVDPKRIASVPIQHFDRAYGSSGYTLKKLVKLTLNVAGFSILPLTIVKRIGEIVSAIGIIGAIILLIKKLIHPAVVLGWSSLIVAIFFFSGVILLTLGIVGEYIGKMFLTMNNYPQYVIRTIYKGDK